MILSVKENAAACFGMQLQIYKIIVKKSNKKHFVYLSLFMSAYSYLILVLRSTFQ